jgi:hypothetical protein
MNHFNIPNFLVWFVHKISFEERYEEARLLEKLSFLSLALQSTSLAVIPLILKPVLVYIV